MAHVQYHACNRAIGQPYSGQRANRIAVDMGSSHAHVARYGSGEQQTSQSPYRDISYKQLPIEGYKYYLVLSKFNHLERDQLCGNSITNIGIVQKHSYHNLMNLMGVRATPTWHCVHCVTLCTYLLVGPHPQKPPPNIEINFMKYLLLMSMAPYVGYIGFLIL